MITDDKNRDEKLQYNINREVAKILALLSGIIITFLLSLRKSFGKQIKTN